mmetsp:Transcript_24445/g.82007  ORF Transcript_24445/g.82007 Transcript_24445/m.82007 type:complete len:138 (+) Transcript_24445:86-499(+)
MEVSSGETWEVESVSLVDGLPAAALDDASFDADSHLYAGGTAITHRRLTHLWSTVGGVGVKVPDFGRMDAFKRLDERTKSDWIALVERGEISIEEKVRHALVHGAQAIIVYDAPKRGLGTSTPGCDQAGADHTPGHV